MAKKVMLFEGNSILNCRKGRIKIMILPNSDLLVKVDTLSI